MVTFKAVVLEHHKKPDGSYNVKIRVTHKRKSKYIATSIIARKEDLTRSLEIREHSPLDFKCHKEIEPMVEAVSRIGYLDLEGMDVDDVVRRVHSDIRNRNFSLDFFVFADKFIASKSEGTGKIYRNAVNTFESFIGERRCDINDIDARMAGNLVQFLREKEGLKDATIKLYLNYLSTIINDAKDKYNDEDMGVINIPRSPFKKLKFGTIVHSGQDSLTLDEMQRIISYNEELSETKRFALDVYILSFALMGMNLADLYEAKYSRNVLTYYRKKTRSRRVDRAEMKVLLPECVNQILARLADPKKEYLINPKFKNSTGYYFSSSLSHRIGNLTEMILGRRLTPYSARHSWATYARNECGFDKGLVDECLDHTSSYKMADVYIKRDWSKIHDAQMRVIGLFRW